jgi:tyrosyl-tRNA synthetase
MDLYGELAWRGLVEDATDGVQDLLAREKITAYIGFDPTASSLHVGSLLPMMALAHLQRCGHSPIAVVGGGTGLIGDPSGKTTERALLTSEQVDANVAGIQKQLARVLDFEAASNPARIVNNAEWLTTIGAIDFMRDIGKHFSVSAMLAKESVRLRISSEEGISYTEFSYSLLQAYDFLELYQRFGCRLQMGGRDQWGNITAGMDLIRRVSGGSERAYGLVLPLITTAAGAKFGKTEAGTVWLDPARTSPYEFFQFWLHVADEDAGKYLRFFTFLDRPRIEALEEASRQELGKRHAQRELAREVTRMVHGEQAVQDAEEAARTMFRDLSSMSAPELRAVFSTVPSAIVAEQPEGWRLPSLVMITGLASSMGEATRLIRQRAVHVNGRLMTDEKLRLTVGDAIGREFFVVKKGKQQNALVRIERSPS